MDAHSARKRLTVTAPLYFKKARLAILIKAPSGRSFYLPYVLWLKLEDILNESCIPDPFLYI